MKPDNSTGTEDGGFGASPLLGNLYRDVTIREVISPDGSRRIERIEQSFHDDLGLELSDENVRQEFPHHRQSMWLRLTRMVRRWQKDADQYQAQVEEARTKNLPHDQMLSMMTCLRACAKEVQREADALALAASKPGTMAKIRDILNSPNDQAHPQPPTESPASDGSVAARYCQLCGERIPGQVWEWRAYDVLCGLCVDDQMNKDYKARHDTAMQKPQNDQGERANSDAHQKGKVE